MSMMLIVTIIAAANLIVGCLIGICGIAGFLLPMLYTGFLGMTVDQALSYSFAAFFLSGAIGSYRYNRRGNLDLNISFSLGIGSLIGAVSGVFLQAMIPKSQAKCILYFVVLFSGCSILYRTWKDSKKKQETSSPAKKQNKILLLSLGLITGCICSLSGAGGPVLVMPLLVVLGVPVRTAVGVALFDSVFIAIPAMVGYIGRCEDFNITIFMVVILFHGFGTFIGSRIAERVPVRALKIFVAIFSICLALYMLHSF